MGYVTPKIIHFRYLNKYFLDQSIPKKNYLVFRTDALALVTVLTLSFASQSLECMAEAATRKPRLRMFVILTCASQIVNVEPCQRTVSNSTKDDHISNRFTGNLV